MEALLGEVAFSVAAEMVREEVKRQVAMVVVLIQMQDYLESLEMGVKLHGTVVEVVEVGTVVVEEETLPGMVIMVEILSAINSII